MLCTGDVQGCLRKLETLLRVIKYPGHVDFSGLSKGDPSAFLPIVSFTLTSFSPPFAEQVVAAGLELTGKTDLRFTDTLYKVLRDIFHYKPILSKQQFLQWGFSQRKISVICDIINLVLQRHNQMKKPKVRYPASHKDGRAEAYATLTDPHTVSDRPFVVNHIENPSVFPQSFHKEAFSSHKVTNASQVHASNSIENGITELAGGEEDKDDVLHSPEVEGRLLALEVQLGSLHFGVDRLCILEKRLEELERRSNIDKFKMLCTGDVQGCLRKLETLLRVIKYPGHVDFSGLSKGDPSAFLPIVSFTLTSFSPPFAEQVVAAGLELTGKTDLRFTDTLYKVLRDIFHYKPILSKQQFLQWGFSQRKISVICDIINLVLQRHNQMKKPKVRYPASHKDGRAEAYATLTDPHTVSDRPFVVNHIENPSVFPQSFHKEAFSSHKVTNASQVHASNSIENGITELAGGEEDKDDVLHSPEVEGRLLALEVQLGSLHFGVDRLCILEKRLEELERRSNIDKNEGQVITISRESWENLMSRVLLLETKLELSNTQLQSSVPPPCQSSTSSYSSSSVSDASKEDLKDRLERITNMLKSTSSLLKNTESSTTPCK